MIVVADTAPLNYLILIGHVDVLESLYGEVVIPPAVQDEMLDPFAPELVRSWISNPPRWLAGGPLMGAPFMTRTLRHERETMPPLHPQ